MGFGLGSFVKKAVGSVLGLGSGSSGSSGLSGGTGLLYGLGLNALDTGLNALTSSYTARQQWKYDKKLLDYENQYNLPVNQRARLEEAGYNPNLALNGVNVQSATTSAPQVQNPKFDLLQAYNLEMQNKLLQSQINYTVDNSLLAQERWNEVRNKNTLNGYNLDYAEAEHELFKKTGKIPQSYYKSDWQAELTSLIKGLLN